MPHQCTNCGRTFEDGSKRMLAGCPDCGGKKFQFLPGDVVEAADGTSHTQAESNAETQVPSEPDGDAGESMESPPETTAAGSPNAGSSTAVDRATSTLREWMRGGGGDAGSDDVKNPAVDSNGTSEVDSTLEDTAQADARRTVVSKDELPPPPEREDVVDIPDAERPDLSELRAELNDQFESIKIVEPGQYELNLMELYDRVEHIIALEEDGRYVIDVPDQWWDNDE